MSKTYPQLSAADVARTGDGKDGRPSLVIVNGDVLDVSKFASIHPGGRKVLLEYAGKDATEAFYELHRHESLEKYRGKLKKGELSGYDSKMYPTNWRELSKVPYAEVDMNDSPFYNDSHRRFRLVCREFLWDEGILKWCDSAETSAKSPPRAVIEKLGRVGFLTLQLGIGPHLKYAPADNLWARAGIAPEDLDLFHWSIMNEERARMMCPGSEDGLMAGLSIGLGPVLHFGQPWTKEEVVPSVFAGSKVICLCITEPKYGSDVASVATTATLSADGSHYVVNGTKKWITNGHFADYFTTLVRTSDAKGARGLSMMLIEKGPGVTVRKIPTTYSLAAGTALVSFEDVKVPVRNLLGKEGQGMRITMHNFNMERMMIVTSSVARSRRSCEETFLWAKQRQAFGRSLLQQPVIRNHLGKMVAEYQSVFSFYQALLYKYNTLPFEARAGLGGETALLKYRATRAATMITDLAIQVFGGRGITKTGMGKNITRIHMSYKMASVYGGSEEIMLDLGMRQAMKAFPINARL